ncbi:hypothetical protein [Undibacterium sp. Ji49W]|uniref:hypothetical protein n=1 Tax=Undibacterium sp. Ji49W TaxID=3413040 RepID=UPI003BF2417F
MLADRTLSLVLSVDEQAVLLKQNRKEISAFFDIPFKDFDLLDTIENPFDFKGNRMHSEEDAIAT